MERERIERYKNKIDLALDRLSKIEYNIDKFDDEMMRLAIYKAFQEVVEVLTDIISMILSDINHSIGDDYANIDKIKDTVKLNNIEVEILYEANGLRNRIIHWYNKTDNEQAKESIERLIPEINKILIKLLEFIKNFKNDKTKNKNKKFKKGFFIFKR